MRQRPERESSPFPPETDFSFPTQDVLARINQRDPADRDCESQQSNRGSVSRSSNSCRIAQAAPDAALLVDEAYFEFCGESLVPQVAGRFPTCLSRARFRKPTAWPGCESACLMGNPEQMSVVRPGQFSVQFELAWRLACLPDALADQEFVRNYVAQTTRKAANNSKTNCSRLGHPLLAQPRQFCVDAFRREMQAVSSPRCASAAFWCATARAIPAAQDCVRITVGTARAQSSRCLQPARSLRPDLACGRRWRDEKSRDRPHHQRNQHSASPDH